MNTCTPQTTIHIPNMLKRLLSRQTHTCTHTRTSPHNLPLFHALTNILRTSHPVSHTLLSLLTPHTPHTLPPSPLPTYSHPNINNTQNSYTKRPSFTPSPSVPSAALHTRTPRRRSCCVASPHLPSGADLREIGLVFLCVCLRLYLSCEPVTAAC